MNPSERTVRVALMTAPDADSARRIARALVEERLAACVSLVPGMRSVYRWEGRIEEQEEVLLLAKTRAECVARLGERLRDLHPYDVPELIALPATGGLESYLDWVARETAP